MTIRVTSPTDLGALVREARERRGWTQTDLGARVGASRFWVAAFERGKPGAELGLALRAAAAVGLQLRAEPPGTDADAAPPAAMLGRARDATAGSVPGDASRIDLDEIVGTESRTDSSADDERVALHPARARGARDRRR